MYISVLVALFGLLLSGSTSAESIPTTVTIKPSIGLNLLTDTVVLDLDPTTNPFDSETISISVGTNNRTGYSLIMSADNTELVNTVDNTKTIPTLVSSVSESNFPANHWGYRLGTDTTANYLPFSSGTTINSKSTKINNDITNITLASKVDYLQVAGSYKQTFTFKALPNITTNYMQNLDPTLCTEEPMLVVDSRDEQIYTIRRLADGKCWMLDNLNLDLTNETVVNNLTTANTHADANSLRSLKQGYRDDCLTEGGSDCYRYATSGLTLSNWVDGGSNPTTPALNVSGVCSTNPPNYPNTGCTYDGTYTSSTVLSTLTPNQSTFGLGSGRIGVYYNYCAASAGNYCYGQAQASADTPPSGTNADYDICPANWRMPTGGASGELAALCAVINKGPCGNTAISMDAASPTSMQYILSTPFVWNYYAGYARHQGDMASFWLSTYYNYQGMYRYVANPTHVDFGNANLTGARRDGHPVRCLLNES